MEHISDPTPKSCIARSLRDAMSDEEFDVAGSRTPPEAEQARLMLNLIRHRDAALPQDEALFYQWKQQRRRFLDLDLETVLLQTEWIYNISYEEDTPAERAR
ncbi:hypothetical protein DOTSEDRAFT_29684 [Dothistroma septosporum NZE10]|uniref:Uncharacterized protein n=1 Tax=Dothistroma septosporum (strain NZE10 / CBS 128990) TaxID=675120 RepID=M2YHW5_DOTSN|nr:hypothetical protein DOTSEDRAFT_29684 [Dothistroma septosporum NZE10]